MLTLSFSRYSLLGDAEHPYIKQCIDLANDTLKQAFPASAFSKIAKTAEFTLALCLDREDSDEHNKPATVSLNDPLLKAVVILKYTHPDSLNKKEHTWSRREGALSDLSFMASAVLHHVHSQLVCQHTWGRPLSKAGIPFPDGRRICVHCELEHADGLPALNGAPVFSTSFNGDEVCRHPWPGDIKLQGGDSGLVLCAKGEHYNTAFFEAFPTYGTFSTFLRGEGATLHDAETAAWKKHQRILSCDAHQWSRNVNGKLREDGYARCELCGLCTHALAPLTVCKTCERPTTLKMARGDFLCPTHYYAQPDHVLTEDKLDAYRDCRGDEYAELCRNKVTFRALVDAFFHRMFLRELSPDDYERHERLISHWANHLIYLITHAAHKLAFSKADEVPSDLSDPVTARCLAHTEHHLAQFLQALETGKPEIKNSFFLPGDFLNKD